MPELGRDNDKIPKLSFSSLHSIKEKSSFVLKNIWTVTDVDGNRKTIVGLDGGYWYTATGLDVGRSKRALALLYVIRLWFPSRYKTKNLSDSDIPQDVSKNWHWTPEEGFQEFWSKK